MGDTWLYREQVRIHLPLMNNCTQLTGHSRDLWDGDDEFPCIDSRDITPVCRLVGLYINRVYFVAFIHSAFKIQLIN